MTTSSLFPFQPPAPLFAALRRLTGLGAVAAVGLSLAASCGKSDDSSNDPAGSTGGATNPPGGTTITDPNTGTSDNTGGTGGTNPTPTDTSVTLVTELSHAPKPAIYGVLLEDGSKVILYPYDQCAYIKASHDPAGSSAASDANGDGLILDISASGINASSNMTYTITKNTTGNDITYDKNVIGTYRYPPSGNDCDITTRPALSGTVSFGAVDGSQVTGTIDAAAVSYEPSITGSLKGTFVAKKCGLPSVAPSTTYNNEPTACHDSADQTARKTSGGLHYM